MPSNVSWALIALRGISANKKENIRIKEKIKGKFHQHFIILLYNLIVPSVSPKEFLATHLYDPKSDWLTARMLSFITTLYALSISTGSNFPPKKWAKHNRNCLNLHNYMFQVKVWCLCKISVYYCRKWLDYTEIFGKFAENNDVSYYLYINCDWGTENEKRWI